MDRPEVKSFLFTVVGCHVISYNVVVSLHAQRLRCPVRSISVTFIFTFEIHIYCSVRFQMVVAANQKGIINWSVAHAYKINSIDQ